MGFQIFVSPINDPKNEPDLSQRPNFSGSGGSAQPVEGPYIKRSNFLNGVFKKSPRFKLPSATC